MKSKNKKVIIVAIVVIASLIIAFSIFILYYLTNQQTINTINDLKNNYSFVDNITYSHINSPSVLFSIYVDEVIDIDEGEKVFNDFLEHMNKGLLNELHNNYGNGLHFIMIIFYLKDNNEFLFRFDANGNDDFNKWSLKCSEHFYDIDKSKYIYEPYRKYYRL